MGFVDTFGQGLFVGSEQYKIDQLSNGLSISFLSALYSNASRIGHEKIIFKRKLNCDKALKK